MDVIFRRHLDELDLGIRTLSTLVIDGIPRATETFLQADQRLAHQILVAHEGAKDLPGQIEAAVVVDIARRSPMGSDLRFLVTVLRVAPALGRCLELVDHIAARDAVSPYLPGPAVAAVAQMGAAAAAMWEEAGRAWCESDATAASRLDEMDDELDAAVVELPYLLRDATLTPRLAMQAVMVGRFYERLGDQAVDFARRTRWNVTGERTSPDASA
jgi:phosphate transport system protein